VVVPPSPLALHAPLPSKLHMPARLPPSVHPSATAGLAVYSAVPLSSPLQYGTQLAYYQPAVPDIQAQTREQQQQQQQQRQQQQFMLQPVEQARQPGMTLQPAVVSQCCSLLPKQGVHYLLTRQQAVQRPITGPLLEGSQGYLTLVLRPTPLHACCTFPPPPFHPPSTDTLLLCWLRRQACLSHSQACPCLKSVCTRMLSHGRTT